MSFSISAVSPVFMSSVFLFSTFGKSAVKHTITENRLLTSHLGVTNCMLAATGNLQQNNTVSKHQSSRTHLNADGYTAGGISRVNIADKFYAGITLLL